MAKKLILGVILTDFGPNLVPKFFSWDLPQLEVKHCGMLSLHAISKKTNESNLKKWQKTSSGPDFGPIGPNIFFLDFTSTRS